MTYFFKTEHGDYINANEVHHFCVKKVQTNMYEVRAYLKTMVNAKERDYVSVKDEKSQEMADLWLGEFVGWINSGE